MITVRYFASIRERLNCADENLEISAEGISVNTLVDQLVAQHGEKWSTVLKEVSVLVAVNQSVAKFSSKIKDGDEVAFFPPVTGG